MGQCCDERRDHSGHRCADAQACFHCQQAAEMALEAVHLSADVFIEEQAAEAAKLADEFIDRASELIQA